MARREKGFHITFSVDDDAMNDMEQEVDEIACAESAHTPMPIGPMPTSIAINPTNSIK